MEETVSITRSEIAQVFTRWLAAYEANPEEWGVAEGADYGDRCAEYFLKMFRNSL